MDLINPQYLNNYQKEFGKYGFEAFSTFSTLWHPSTEKNLFDKIG